MVRLPLQAPHPGVLPPGAAAGPSASTAAGGPAAFGGGPMDPFLTGVAGNMLRQQGQSYLQRGQAFMQVGPLPVARSARRSTACWQQCWVGCLPIVCMTLHSGLHPALLLPRPCLLCSPRWASCRAVPCTTTSASRPSMVGGRVGGCCRACLPAGRPVGALCG